VKSTRRRLTGSLSRKSAVPAPCPLSPQLEKLGATVWDPDKVVIIWDRFLPPSNVKAAELHKTIKAFAKKYGVHFHDIGRSGILHQLFAEKGYALPSEVIIVRTLIQLPTVPSVRLLPVSVSPKPPMFFPKGTLARVPESIKLKSGASRVSSSLQRCFSLCGRPNGPMTELFTAQ